MTNFQRSVILLKTALFYKNDYTFIDSIKFFDRKDNVAKQQIIQKERTRLIQDVLLEKREGKPTQAVQVKKAKLYECDTIEEEF